MLFDGDLGRVAVTGLRKQSSTTQLAIVVDPIFLNLLISDVHGLFHRQNDLQN